MDMGLGLHVGYDPNSVILEGFPTNLRKEADEIGYQQPLASTGRMVYLPTNLPYKSTKYKHTILEF